MVTPGTAPTAASSAASRPVTSSSSTRWLSTSSTTICGRTSVTKTLSAGSDRASAAARAIAGRFAWSRLTPRNQTSRFSSNWTEVIAESRTAPLAQPFGQVFLLDPTAHLGRTRQQVLAKLTGYAERARRTVEHDDILRVALAAGGLDGLIQCRPDPCPGAFEMPVAGIVQHPPVDRLADHVDRVVVPQEGLRHAARHVV